MQLALIQCRFSDLVKDYPHAQSCRIDEACTSAQLERQEPRGSFGARELQEDFGIWTLCYFAFIRERSAGKKMHLLFQLSSVFFRKLRAVYYSRFPLLPSVKLARSSSSSHSLNATWLDFNSWMMAPANNRFGGQSAGATYSRLPPITLPTNLPGHHSFNSGSLPPPSFHHAFE